MALSVFEGKEICFSVLPLVLELVDEPRKTFL